VNLAAPALAIALSDDRPSAEALPGQIHHLHGYILSRSKGSTDLRHLELGACNASEPDVEQRDRPLPVARGTAANTFTAFRDVSPTDIPATVAGQLVKGSKVVLEAWGEYSCATGVTLQLGFIYNATAGAAGGTTLAASSAITTGTVPDRVAVAPQVVRRRHRDRRVRCDLRQGILDLGTSLTAISATARRSRPLPGR
jgi:hypothetical protein